MNFAMDYGSKQTKYFNITSCYNECTELVHSKHTLYYYEISSIPKVLLHLQMEPRTNMYNWKDESFHLDSLDQIFIEFDGSQ